MNNIVYQIAIKKEYAAAVIEDLKLMDAIEILEHPIPEWQQQETLRRMADYAANPYSGISKEAFFNELN
jgi:putative addiction module component (TIGR02574 family)